MGWRRGGVNPAASCAYCCAGTHLQSLRLAGEEQGHRVSSEFFVYGTRTSKDKSGAYLFLPDGEAKVRSPPMEGS